MDSGPAPSGAATMCNCTSWNDGLIFIRDTGGTCARGRAVRKTIACGNAGRSGVLVVTRVRSTTTIAHETAGASGTRHSPRPLWGRNDHAQLGRIAPRGAKPYVELEQRHCERSEAIHLATQRKNGLRRFARNDGSTTEASWLSEKLNRTTNPLVMPGLDPGIHPSS